MPKQKKVLTFRNFLQHLGLPEQDPTTIFEDNQGTTDIVNAGRLTPRVKHIDIPLCFLHEHHQKGAFVIQQCSTHLMLADGLNKALAGPTIKRHASIYVGKRFYPKENTVHLQALTRLVPLSLWLLVIFLIHMFRKNTRRYFHDGGVLESKFNFYADNFDSTPRPNLTIESRPLIMACAILSLRRNYRM